MLSGENNPWDFPGWHAVHREAALVRHLVGSGVTALGRANYADGFGEYYTAFFGLSVGLERLAKLILVANFSIAHSGALPAQSEIARFGHQIFALTEVIGDMPRKSGVRRSFERPDNPVSWEIVKSLDAFADARRGRYANFAELGDPSLDVHEPVKQWWENVARLILDLHFNGGRLQARAEAYGGYVERVMAPAHVQFFDEMGAGVLDLREVARRAAETEVVQKYGRYYSLLVVRWLVDAFADISKEACYEHGAVAFQGAWELLATYQVNESLLKNRKRWPLN